MRCLAPDVGGVDARPVLHLELRVVDGLHLDLAGLDVRDRLVTGHRVVSLRLGYPLCCGRRREQRGAHERREQAAVGVGAP